MSKIFAAHHKGCNLFCRMEKGFGLNPKAVAQRDASFGCRQCMHDVQCPSDFLKVACSQVELFWNILTLSIVSG